MQKKVWVGFGVCILLVCIGLGVGLGVGLGMKKASSSNNNNIQGSSAIQDENSTSAVVESINGVPVQTSALTTSYLSSATIQSILDSHNSRRSKAGLAPLSWDLSVEDFAYKYGQTLKSGGCTMTHSSWTQRSTVAYGSGTTAGTGVGENLAWSSGSLTFSSASSMWWDSEVTKYWYGPSSATCEKSAGSNVMVGHYTQMAWANTKFIGCAVNTCSSGATIINCNYGPPGNYVNDLPFPASSACAQGLKPQCQNPVSGCSSLTGTSCQACSPTPAPVLPPTAPTAPTAAPKPTPAPTRSPTPSSCVSNTGCVIKTTNCAVNPTKVKFTCNGATSYSGATVGYTLTMPPTYTWDLSGTCTSCTNVVQG